MLVSKKACTKCDGVLPRSEFYVQKNDPSGLHSWCKPCFKQERKSSYHRDLEQSRRKGREYRDRNIEAARERDRQRSKTPEFRERMRSYRRHELPEVKQYMEAYRAANSEKMNEYARKRRARVNALPSEDYDRYEIYARDGWDCQLCGESVPTVLRGSHPLSPSIDHIIPYNHPDCPGDLVSNVQLTHFGCNSAKRDRLLKEEQ